ncbi:transporter, small conductance mechanosensitive ion channel MscS family protein [Gleimia coleocanis DSM 15436]|uniref:Transporter, small conductance mechanosensitive ion channel MscS family protein n=1 Tax=Gleimia coleocanis DSM 15436 TaxID=525245 RepID=C0VYT7_9ACTO|nr:mechanosensitive ion channel domain-containing protein [Gleimia coleocanis]EEH64590.1 transporter, small conductance mechanosensitive ion channel MscS family protein [Gleimia coleocanis DSM 15436]
METTETAVDEAVDILHFVLSAAVGALVTFLIGVICWAIIRVIAKRSEAIRILNKRIRTPFLLLFPTLGTWLGIKFAREQLPADEIWTKPIHHISLILTIACVGWLCYAAANTIHDVAQARSMQNASRRLTTQAQMISRILQAVIVILTTVSIVLTFPEARVLMGSLLASAGVISLVAGLAAQDSLSNTFAGLQLTFTDAIRVGDQLSVDGLNGTVEEITLTYVVLRVWDDRRIILPSTTFTKNKFENWTRVHAKLLGTVELKLDWRAPVNLIRQEVDRLLAHTDLWDKRTVNVQVTDSNEQWIIVRVVISADNSGKLWDLKCYLRENLVNWIIQNAPYALARHRYQQEEITEIFYDRTEEEIVKLAQELVALENAEETQVTKAHSENSHSPAKTAQEARVQASKKRAVKVRRKRLKDRVSELRTNPETEPINSPTSNAEPKDENPTLVMSHTEVGKLTANLHNTQAHGLYSGSEDAEARQKLTQGPGAEAFRHREESTVMRAIRDGEMTIQEALDRTTEYPELQQKIKDTFAEKRES